MAWRKLTDAQREKVQVHTPATQPSPLGGRPRADDRRCFEREVSGSCGRVRLGASCPEATGVQ